MKSTSSGASRSLFLSICIIFCAICFSPHSAEALGLRYWDLNGPAAGAGGATPSGTWGTDANWSTNRQGNGPGPNQGWQANHAVFAVLNDAVGAYTVTVDGTQPVGDIHFDYGTVTVQGGTLELDGPANNPETRLISVFDGNIAFMNTPLVNRFADGVMRLRKYKRGTLVLGGANIYSGNTEIVGGTIRLGAADRLPDTSNLILANGGQDNIFDTPATFDTGGFSETMGTLQVTGADAKIDFGSGASALVFADSDSQDWSGLNLAIANFTPGIDSLRIGIDGTGFDTQLALILFTDFNNASGKIDAAGFITPNLPVFLSIQRTGVASIDLTWTTIPGRTYRIQYKTNLNDVGWTDIVPDISAGDITASATDTAATSEERYYRVLLL